jgi:hypothetical protein
VIVCTQRIKPSRGLFLCIRAIITSLHLCHVTGEYFFLCHDVYPLFVVSKVPVEGVGRIVGTSNSTDNRGLWIGLGIVLYS